MTVRVLTRRATKHYRRPTELLFTRGNVQRVQTIDVVSGRLGGGDQVNRVCSVIDDGRAEDADFRKVGGLVVRSRNRGPQVHVPQRALLSIGVKSIDVVVQGHRIDDVMRPLAWNRYVLNVKRLPVDVSADRKRE